MTSNRDAREPRRGRVVRGEEPRTAEGMRACRFCGNVVSEKRRRTFCSDSCVHEHKIRSSSSYLKQAVLDRDKGICEGCGIDCLDLDQRILAGAGGGLDEPLAQSANGFPQSRIAECRAHGRSLWDAAHRVPVAWGSGGCGLDGLKTLCARCHARETTGQAALWGVGLFDPHQETLWGSSLETEVGVSLPQSGR